MYSVKTLSHSRAPVTLLGWEKEPLHLCWKFGFLFCFSLFWVFCVHPFDDVGYRETVLLVLFVCCRERTVFLHFVVTVCWADATELGKGLAATPLAYLDVGVPRSLSCRCTITTLLLDPSSSVDYFSFSTWPTALQEQWLHITLSFFLWRSSAVRPGQFGCLLHDAKFWFCSHVENFVFVFPFFATVSVLRYFVLPACRGSVVTLCFG